jgi:ABC-type antimicrobial peptide transport system permease subunit
VQYLINYLGTTMQIEQLAMIITTNVMALAFTVTLVVGILAGILPAKRAANLKPIDALRFE